MIGDAEAARNLGTELETWVPSCPEPPWRPSGQHGPRTASRPVPGV